MGTLVPVISLDTSSAVIMDEMITEAEVIPQYFPGDGDINFWTFAMVTISLTFLVFVGCSVAIMCKSETTTGSQRCRTTNCN